MLTLSICTDFSPYFYQDDPPYSEALYFQANNQLQLTSGVRIEPLLGESCSHVKCSNNKAIEFNEGCYLKAVDCV